MRNWYIHLESVWLMTGLWEMIFTWHTNTCFTYVSNFGWGKKYTDMNDHNFDFPLFKRFKCLLEMLGFLWQIEVVCCLYICYPYCKYFRSIFVINQFFLINECLYIIHFTLFSHLMFFFLCQTKVLSNIWAAQFKHFVKAESFQLYNLIPMTG